MGLIIAFASCGLQLRDVQDFYKGLYWTGIYLCGDLMALLKGASGFMINSKQLTSSKRTDKIYIYRYKIQGQNKKKCCRPRMFSERRDDLMQTNIKYPLISSNSQKTKAVKMSGCFYQGLNYS